jgi:hypothetical protein
MSETEPQAQKVEEKVEEEEIDLYNMDVYKEIKEAHDFRVNIEVMTSLVRLPKVFVEGHTGVKVTLIDNYVNCSKYVLGSYFSGCMSYHDGEFREVKGIYKVPRKPFLSIQSIPKISKTDSRMENLIQNHIKELITNIKIFNKDRKELYENLLIAYDSRSIRVYGHFKKGKTIKFPLHFEHQDLKISWIPKPSVKLSYVTRKDGLFNDYRIVYEKEIIEFQPVMSFGGAARILFNPYIKTVKMQIETPNNEVLKETLPPKMFFLMTYPKRKPIGIYGGESNDS